MILRTTSDNMDSWIPTEEYEVWKKSLEDFSRAVLWGSPKREPREDDNVKLAWVFINNERVMVGMDNQTMKAYKLRDDVPTWNLPLQPIEYDTFERWCTSFDV